MSLSDIKTDIKFGATSTVTKTQIAESKFDILGRQRERAAEDLGREIAKVKGWQMCPEGDLAISELRLYVFAPNELRDFLDAKLKKRMLELAQEDYVDDKTRQVVKMMSERI